MTKEEAIKHLSEWMDEKMWRCFGTIDREAIGIAIEALKDKPMGEWIDSRDTDTPWNDGFKCSACNRNSLIRYNFCPYCGTRMLRKDSEV